MFEVGEYVKIKPDAKEITCMTGWNDQMDKFLGGTYKIVRKTTHEYALEGVKSEGFVVNRDGYWLWNEKWLEDVIEFEEDDIMSLLEIV